jgi:uncharacterized protein
VPICELRWPATTAPHDDLWLYGCTICVPFFFISVEFNHAGNEFNIEFEWDPLKADSNLRKHGVLFTDAATVFSDPLSMTVYDPDHSLDENRYIIVGMSHRSRLLIVAFAERGNRIRIISARQLTGAERKTYEKYSD